VRSTRNEKVALGPRVFSQEPQRKRSVGTDAVVERMRREIARGGGDGILQGPPVPQQIAEKA